MAHDAAHAFSSALKTFKTASGKSGKFWGVITGRALYDGRLDLAAAIAMAERV